MESLAKSTESEFREKWHKLGRLKPLGRFWRLHLRLIFSAAFGAAIAIALLALPWRMPTRILLGWDAGVLLYLGLVWRITADAPVMRIRYRAAVTDEGATLVLLLTTAAAVASIAAVIAELGHKPAALAIAVGVGTVLLSWLFMHVIFALHYAHEFYGKGRDHGIGGLTFPGDEDPDYWDFLYYSLVVAMTAQVSDVQITSKTIRRLTTVHGVISFFFNVAVLALGINIVSSLM